MHPACPGEHKILPGSARGHSVKAAAMEARHGQEQEGESQDAVEHCRLLPVLTGSCELLCHGTMPWQPTPRCPAQPHSPEEAAPSPELLWGGTQWDPKDAATETPALTPAHGPVRAIPGDAGPFWPPARAEQVPGTFRAAPRQGYQSKGPVQEEGQRAMLPTPSSPRLCASCLHHHIWEEWGVFTHWGCTAGQPLPLRSRKARLGRGTAGCSQQPSPQLLAPSPIETGPSRMGTPGILPPAAGAPGRPVHAGTPAPGWPGHPAASTAGLCHASCPMTTAPAKGNSPRLPSTAGLSPMALIHGS